jgi:hypothetical protein
LEKGSIDLAESQAAEIRTLDLTHSSAAGIEKTGNHSLRCYPDLR